MTQSLHGIQRTLNLHSHYLWTLILWPSHCMEAKVHYTCTAIKREPLYYDPVVTWNPKTNKIAQPLYGNPYIMTNSLHGIQRPLNLHSHTLELLYHDLVIPWNLKTITLAQPLHGYPYIMTQLLHGIQRPLNFHSHYMGTLILWPSHYMEYKDH